jgi:hypothetical protein
LEIIGEGKKLELKLTKEAGGFSGTLWKPHQK